MWIDIVSIIVRTLSFVAALQTTGVAVFLAIFGRLLSDSVNSIARLGRGSAWLGVGLVVTHQLLGGGRMTGTLSGVLDAELQSFAIFSSTGLANAVRLTGLVLLGWSFKRHQLLKKLHIVGVLLVCISFSLTGHTSVHEHRGLLAPLLTIHVVIVACWFGSLLPLYIVSQRESLSAAAKVVAAFTALASRLVPIIAVAGLWMTVLLLPAVNALFKPYGLLLLAKALGFSITMGLAALNKWRFGPAIKSGDAHAVQAFRRSVVAEYLIIIAILAATSTMTSLFSPE